MQIRLIVRRSLAIVLLSRKKISLLAVQCAKTFLLIPKVPLIRHKTFESLWTTKNQMTTFLLFYWHFYTQSEM